MKFKSMHWRMGKKNTQDRYTDLAPTDSADNADSYMEALEYAVGNKKVRNIALSGPYGAGKSSIIETYRKRTGRKILNISLASFSEDEEKNPSNKESEEENEVKDKKNNENKNPSSASIERSILQQMLYSVDPSEVPYSRFKRIATPSNPIIKLSLFILWIAMMWLLYKNSWNVEFNDITSSAITGNIIKFVIIGFAIGLPLILMADIYRSTFGISLKKISLKNAEIETGEIHDDSILNRHLDEVIYFFNQTNFEIVAIEDLDRFRNPEIFVKLREINKLINSSSDRNKISTLRGKKTVKFIYAIKDDIFTQNDRAKFFDFIIPVIPYVDSSNSLDAIQRNLSKTKIIEKIDNQFLREVSLYLDDARLIQNTINEFSTWSLALNSGNLNPNKLLAILIYKNTYPKDFEYLRYRKGAFYEICSKRKYFIENRKTEIITQIEKIKDKIKQSDDESISSIEELIYLYVSRIVRENSLNMTPMSFEVNGENIPLTSIDTLAKIKPVIDQQMIILQVKHHHGTIGNHYTNKSFKFYEDEVNPKIGLLDRCRSIENRSKDQREKFSVQISELQQNLADLSSLSLMEISNESHGYFDEIYEKNNIHDGNLITFLVNSGFLDIDYNYYISAFHEGRITKNDREFIISVRNDDTQGIGHWIDNPEEVCANLRLEDFGRVYALNARIIDYLISTSVSHQKELKLIAKFIENNPADAEQFLFYYMTSGVEFNKFVGFLSLECPGFPAIVIKEFANPFDLIFSVLDNTDPQFLISNTDQKLVLASFIEKNASDVFIGGNRKPKSFGFLPDLRIRFPAIEEVYSYKESYGGGVFLATLEHNAYLINIQNVNFLLMIDGYTSEEINTQNFTSVLSSSNLFFKEYILQNLHGYIEHVFLELPANVFESGHSVSTLLDSDQLSLELKEVIIETQNHVFYRLDEVPAPLWPQLMSFSKIDPTWSNVISYLGSNFYDESILVKYLTDPVNAAKLSSSSISISEFSTQAIKSISVIVFSLVDLDNKSYSNYIKCVPNSFNSLPKTIPQDKLVIIASAHKASLDPYFFNEFSHAPEFLASLILHNFDHYKSNPDDYPINDNIRSFILNSDSLNSANKVFVAAQVSISSISPLNSLSKSITSLIIEDPSRSSFFDKYVLQECVSSGDASPESIMLLAYCMKSWSEDELVTVLGKMHKPFCDLGVADKRPTIENNPFNFEIVRYLEEINLISSFTSDMASIKVYNHGSKRTSE